MYNSDPGFTIESNWNKDPGFIVKSNWDKDPGFSPPVSGRDFLREYLSGGEEYSQSGTNIPSFGISRSYEGGGGTGMEPYFNEQIAATPMGSTGGSRGEFDPAYLEKLKQKGEPPLDPDFFEKIRQQLGKAGVKEAEAPRYIRVPPDIDSPAADRWIKNIRSAPGYAPPATMPSGDMLLQKAREMRGLAPGYGVFGV
jgi:hypothetical protein